MKKNKAKKGITLIEVIISVTLLSILIIPLSTIVIKSLNNKEEASDRQKATYIGQKILEELKAYDVITLKEDSNTKYFNLLDGLDSDKEIKEVENTDLKNFKGEFKRNIFGNEKDNPSEKLFNVEVSINKNEDFISDFNYIDKNLVGYKLILKDELIYYGFKNESNDNTQQNIKRSKEKIKIDIRNNNFILSSDEESKDISEISDKKYNTLIINLEDSYNQLTNIEVINSKESDLLEIILIKNKAENNSINIISSEGNILIKEINLDDRLDLKDTYNYEVTVKNENNKELFKSKSSSKFTIE